MRFVSLLFCLSFVGHGRGVQTLNEQRRAFPHLQTSLNNRGLSRGLSALLFALKPAAAFHPSGTGALQRGSLLHDPLLQGWRPTALTPATTMGVSDVSIAGQAEVVGFPQLRARDFQHPRDKTLTQQAGLAVPIEFVFRRIVAFFEDAGFLLNIARGVQVSSTQYPTLHRLVVEAAAQMDLPVPDMFVTQNSQPNAYTFAVQGERPFIVLHTSLIDLMTLEEVKAVIGHELGHLKCEHSLTITVANILALGIDAIEALIPLGLRDLIERQLTQWRRSAELSCDRAALLVTQDEKVVMSVLMKLTGGSAKLAGEMSAEAFANQARKYDETARSSMLGRMIRNQDENQLYPLPMMRAREIQKYAESREYISLKKRLGTTIKV